MGSVGENSSTGDVGGDVVGGRRDEDDLTSFCAGGAASAVDDTAVDKVAPAPEEITGVKMRVARAGSSSLSCAKWMNSSRSSPLRLLRTRNVMSFVYFSLASCWLNKLPRLRAAAGPRIADNCCLTKSSVASKRRSLRCS